MKYVDAKTKEHFCPNCEETVKVEIWEGGAEGTKHFAKAICSNCRAFIEWIGKPENDEKRTKTSKYTVASIGLGYCEICGRKKDRLGLYECFELHHKVPINEGGPDARSNILILCTPCHRMCHFLRTYLRDHHMGTDNDTETS